MTDNVTENGAAQVAPVSIQYRTDDAAWEFDLNRVKHSELQQFTEDMQTAISGKNDKPALPWMARCIVRWPFEGEATSESIDNLGALDYLEVAARFLNYFRSVQDHFLVSTPGTGGASRHERRAARKSKANGHGS